MTFRIVRTLMAVAFAACLAAPAAAQGPADDTTYVEFSTPVRLPGVTLTPGKYLFKLGDPRSTQTVVEVYTADGSRLLATLLTVDTTMARPAETGLVTFSNTEPAVVQAWWPAGQSRGHAFVYTEDEARLIAASANTGVYYAAWDPADRAIVGRVDVKTFGERVGDAVAKGIDVTADKTEDVVDEVADKIEDVGDWLEDLFDDPNDNARIVDPTPNRQRAEQQLDTAEKILGQLKDSLDGPAERQLEPLDDNLEKLEDAFERNNGVWIAYYSKTMEALDRLSPDRPVGTSGGSAMLDAGAHARLDRKSVV